ncbi:hypothetical protein P0D88_26535 [Paraburkholderia sp. RL18-103-BIB-C]|uniref:hypothetical protein n=1 Tax=Paraburkholderia sp. RL18-103-BIB-C TaxID=3031637 RepID=UPI0038BA57BF
MKTKTQHFFCSCLGHDAGNWGWAEYLVLYFNNTPKELFAAIEAIEAQTGPLHFYFAYREDAPPGEPPLFVSLRLSRRVSFRHEYQDLAREVAQQFEPYLNPVLRFPAPVVEGGYESPIEPGAPLDPDAYLKPMK